MANEKMLNLLAERYRLEKEISINTYQIMQLLDNLEDGKEYEIPEFDIAARVKYLLKDIGIPMNLKGYNYIAVAIIKCAEDWNLTKGITKKLYPEIAKRFKTTPSRVERAIRHAIEVSYSESKGKMFLEERYGYSKTTKPTNSLFITMLADEFKR